MATERSELMYRAACRLASCLAAGALLTPLLVGAQEETLASNGPRTFDYHQLTPDLRIQVDPVLSGAGNRIVWGQREDESTSHVVSARFDGSERKLVGRWGADLAQIAVSPDGSRVLHTDGRELRDSSRDGSATRTIVKLETPEIVAITYGGGVPRFQIRRDARKADRGIWIPIQRGLYGVDDTGQPIQLVGPEQVADVVGGHSRQVSPFALPHASQQLGVGGDQRVVFGIHSRRNRLMAYHPEEGLRRIVSNIGNLMAIGIGADGGTLFFVTGGDAQEALWLVNWDGRKRRRVKPPALPGFSWSGRPLQLSASGRFVNLGTGIVLDLETGVPISLVASQPGDRKLLLRGFGAHRASMDASTSRFAFLASARGERQEIATLELNVPLGQLRADSPRITDIRVEPGALTPNPSGARNGLSARIDAKRELLVATWNAIRAGLPDPKIRGGRLDDAGKRGDGVAGDGVYSTSAVGRKLGSALHAPPRRIRIDAEVVDSAGLHHAYAAEVGPFEGEEGKVGAPLEPAVVSGEPGAGGEVDR